MKNLEKQENVRYKMKLTLMIKNKVEVAVLSGWFSSRKLEKDREFRSEDLQEEKNEKQVWER